MLLLSGKKVVFKQRRLVVTGSHTSLSLTEIILPRLPVFWGHLCFSGYVMCEVGHCH